MTKADKLRAALRDAGKEGLTNAKIDQITGSHGFLAHYIKTGEVSAVKTADGTRYTLNPDYVPARQRKAQKALPIKRRDAKRVPGGGKKKPARRAAKKRTSRIRRIADAVERAQPLSHLVLQQLIGASKLLRITVTTQVEGVDDNPQLTGALQNAERAETLAAAA